MKAHVLGCVCLILVTGGVGAKQRFAVAAKPVDQLVVERLAAPISKSCRLYYASLRTYAEEAILTFDFQGQVGSVDLSMKNSTVIQRFVFIRDKGFCLDSSDTVIYMSDGSLTLYRPMEAQYRVHKIRSEPTLDDILQAVGPTFQKIRWQPALLGIFSTGDTPQALIPEITKWEAITQGKLGNRGIWHVRARVGQVGSSAEGLPLQMWLDANTCQVLRIELDWSSVLEAQASKLPNASPTDPGTPIKATVTWSVIKSDRNQPVEESRIHFVPAEGDLKVDRFRPTNPALIGKRAPQIKGTTLTGDPFSLVSLEGKVVLLDFWTTWCAPCVAHLPQLQELSTEFKKDLVIVGINADTAEKINQVRRIIEQHGITFPQVTDMHGQVRKRFRVGGFPMLVLIDRNGIVQDASPQMPILRNRIQELLKAGTQAVD